MDDEYAHLALRGDSDILIIELVHESLFRTRMTSALEAELLDLMEKQQPQNVIVDFKNVGRCSTAVINAMIRVKRRVVTQGGLIKLCDMKSSIRDTYKLLNLDGTVFEICGSVDDAVSSIRGG